MEYRIELLDPSGRRLAVCDELPLLEAVRTAPDRADMVRGIFPNLPEGLEHGCRVRVWVGGRRFCEADITRLEPQWGDTRKLILDRYISFQEVMALEAERAPHAANPHVSRAFTGREIGAMVKDLINHARGPIHYGVAHTAYPDGARREYAKFLARKRAENELGYGGIASGQWVGANRIDASQAYARDGDTISGLVVDGVPWPDLRLMMIDAEEMTRNNHARKRHPEVAQWSDARYLASGYRLRADAARMALQQFIDAKGITHIELNPYRDASGAYCGRVDVYGRYLGLIFGGEECFNAALVEQGHAEVCLYDEGRELDPDLQLKDFYSYAGVFENTIEPTGVIFNGLDFEGGLLEAVTALAYGAGGFVWDVDPGLTLSFRRVDAPDRVLYYRAREMSLGYGSDSSDLANKVSFEGSPFATVTATYRCQESIDTYGERPCDLSLYSVSSRDDADLIAAGLLNDLAYPTPVGFITFLRGESTLKVGDVVELRGDPIRRLDTPLSGEWGGRFTGRIIGRVAAITHRFTGRQVTTTVELTSPLRSVSNPLSHMVQSQPRADTLYQFRLDDLIVGADAGFHLD